MQSQTVLWLLMLPTGFLISLFGFYVIGNYLIHDLYLTLILEEVRGGEEELGVFVYWIKKGERYCRSRNLKVRHMSVIV